jgi:hypothetical protein
MALLDLQELELSEDLLGEFPKPGSHGSKGCFSGLSLLLC